MRVIDNKISADSKGLEGGGLTANFPSEIA